MHIDSMTGQIQYLTDDNVTVTVLHVGKCLQSFYKSISNI